MYLKTLIYSLFGIGLLACSSSPNGVHPNRAAFPGRQQTKYIFYNKTGDQIKVVHVDKGKLRKEDGTLLNKPEPPPGDDSIFPGYILNEQGEKEYVTQEYKETSVELEDGECVFTPSYYVSEFTITIRGEPVCGTWSHGETDPERSCSDEVNQIRDEKGWRNRENKGEGPVSYVEFFNIVNKTNLFTEAEEPRQFDDSFTHSCKMLALDYGLHRECVTKNANCEKDQQEFSEIKPNAPFKIDEE